MSKNKSPGLDGLTPEFYKHFWHKIGNLVTESLNNGLEKGELSSTQKFGVLSLIYKKGDPSNMENWRPVTILNTDYKIAAKALANRLKKVIHKLISGDQQGYIRERFIGFNIRQIQPLLTKHI